MEKARIGSISTGTLRPEDLFEAFSTELERLTGIICGCPADPEDLRETIDELTDRLNEEAPPYCYFGTAEGDGADFGFWPDLHAIKDAIYDGELPQEKA